MAVKPIPAGYHTVTPSLTVNNAAAVIDFVQKAFGAKGADVMKMPDGKIAHAELMIGDSRVMLGDATSQNPAHPGSLYLYVENCDEVYRKALQAGGVSTMEMADQFWGDRMGAVRDPGGNEWSIATQIEEVSGEEAMRRMARMAPA
jgi:PhnB protein